MDSRSLGSRCLRLVRPAPTSPRTFSPGTTTSSKNSSETFSARWPSLSSPLPVLNPGVPASTTKRLNASKPGRSAVLATTTSTSAMPPLGQPRQPPGPLVVGAQVDEVRPNRVPERLVVFVVELSPHGGGSGVVAVDGTGDAGRLLGALHLDGEVEGGLDAAARHVLDLANPSVKPNPAADLDRAGEAHLVEAVVHAHADIANVEQLDEHRNDQGQGEVAVRDRRSEGSLLRALHVHMDPLVVPGGVGERVDPLLGDGDPRAGTEILSGQGAEPIEAVHGRGRGCFCAAHNVPLSVQVGSEFQWPRPRSRTALSLRILGLTDSLISSFSKSASQRSGLITGKSEPKRTLSRSSELAYWTSCGGKYFGDQPDRSMCTRGLWVATDSASSCQGNDGWARMMSMSGKSTATSSTSIGLEYFRRIPPPPRVPAPTPVWPVWNSAISPCSAMTWYSG